MKRFSENFDQEAVTYLIFFVGTHWFQKCNFWKNSLSPFWGRRGHWGQKTSKLKMKTQIWPPRPRKLFFIALGFEVVWPQGIFSKIIFLKSVRSNKKDEVCHSFLVKIFTKTFKGCLNIRMFLQIQKGFHPIACEEGRLPMKQGVKATKATEWKTVPEGTTKHYFYLPNKHLGSNNRAKLFFLQLYI